jgi:hypothetical protein
MKTVFLKLNKDKRTVNTFCGSRFPAVTRSA